MAEKSSENENKVFTMTVTRPCKSDPNHGKAWKCGRGEVARFLCGLSSLGTPPFFVQDNAHCIPQLVCRMKKSRHATPLLPQSLFSGSQRALSLILVFTQIAFSWSELYRFLGISDWKVS